MARLLNSSKNNFEILKTVKLADNFSSRLKGLMGSQQLPIEQGLWIKPCNSIHTCFMKYSLDVLFLDKDLKVCDLVSNLKPWKLVLPNFKARSVIEMNAGLLAKFKVEIGDQLHVAN